MNYYEQVENKYNMRAREEKNAGKKHEEPTSKKRHLCVSVSER
jgi:hypothetical protein